MLNLAPVPPYVPATFLTVVVAVASDKLKWRGPFILMFLPIAIAGKFLPTTASLAAVDPTVTRIHPRHRGTGK